LKQYSYDSGAGAGAGKLATAMARNMLTGIAYDVTETYSYSGRMGRVSSRVTALKKGGVANESWTLGVDYDEYGLPSSIDYPTCAGTGCRTGSGTAYNVTLGRTDGVLTSIPNWTTGTIAYHPNLMVATVPHANGSTETIANDPNGLARPLSITATAWNGSSWINEWKTGTYAFDGAGNVMSMTDGAKIDQFKYDKFSRLTGSMLGSLAPSRSQNHAFDPYGNITSITTDGVQVMTPTSATTNRLNATGTTYDPRGSLTAWNGQAYGWDQFRVMKERCTSGTIAACTGELWRYAYTADGERVLALKSDGTKQIWTLRGLDNKVLRRDDTGVVTNYVYRDDRSFGSIDSTGKVQHFATDHLGSIRLITGSTGTKLAEHTYFPFGEEATATTQDSEVMKFTAHERDLMSTPSNPADDLDYMHARYYGSLLGRFTAVDPAPMAEVSADPQAMNRYGYVAGQPLIGIDEDGRQVIFRVVRVIYRAGKRIGYAPRGRITKAGAVAARRKGRDIEVSGRKAKEVIGEAKDLEQKAHPGGELKHHPKDSHARAGNQPHFQTTGKPGHTYYKIASALTAGAYLGQDSLVGQAIDLFNPLSIGKDVLDFGSELGLIETGAETEAD
jgi:RHS repeat-associated protein